MLCRALKSRSSFIQWIVRNDPYLMTHNSQPLAPNQFFPTIIKPTSPFTNFIIINYMSLASTSSLKLHKKEMGKERQYWLLKTEPGEWSWDDQAANGGLTKWDGVKNSQAQKHMKSMKLNDLCFFYHSGARARCVVGVVTVSREWYKIDGEGEGVVDVKEVGTMRRMVDLKEMKKDDGLKGWGLFRQPRLSVVPVPEGVWERVCDLGGGFHGDGREEEELVE